MYFVKANGNGGFVDFSRLQVGDAESYMGYVSSAELGNSLI